MAKQLSSTWKYIGTYRNGKLLTEESVWLKTPDDSIATYYKITAEGYFKLIYLNDSLIDNKPSRLAELELDFDSSGKGNYDELVLGYFQNQEFDELIHPPIPELVFYKRHLVILMTEMTHHYHVKFRLKNDILILKEIERKTEKRYIRIK